jgi:hypothetical protein
VSVFDELLNAKAEIDRMKAAHPKREELLNVLRTLFSWDLTTEAALTKMADAILAAGYRKPRTIDNVAELNALPSFSVIRIQQGQTLERLSDGWYEAALENTFTAYPIWLPATVLYEPEPTN